MSRDPAKTLELFFGIDQRSIDHDIVHAPADRTTSTRELESLIAIPYKLKTPKIEARVAHLSLVKAKLLSSKEGIADELRVFYAAFGAGYVVQDAEAVSWNKGSLAELEHRMDAIRKREGLAHDEFWVDRNAGPPDYRELSEEFSRLAKKVVDTVFVYILRRYGLHEQAELYERDEAEFEIQREIGRRAVFGDQVAKFPDEEETRFDSFMDDFIEREYGATALERVRRRAKMLGDWLQGS